MTWDISWLLRNHREFRNSWQLPMCYPCCHQAFWLSRSGLLVQCPVPLLDCRSLQVDWKSLTSVANSLWESKDRISFSRGPPSQESTINSCKAYKPLKNQPLTFQFYLLLSPSTLPSGNFLHVPGSVWFCLIFGQMLFPRPRTPHILTLTFPVKLWFILFVTA